MLSSDDDNLALVYGTRPELIKLFPIIRELEERRIPFVTISTGQQRDLLRTTEVALGIQPTEVFESSEMEVTYAARLGVLTQNLAESFPRFQSSGVIVQGDTLTTLAGALAGFLAGLPVFHVEAGLRTGDISNPFPEEGSRQVVARLASVHFAPTPLSRENLVREGIDPQKIVVSGNTVVDSMRIITSQMKTSANRKGSGGGEKKVLVSLHRREVHGELSREIWEIFENFALDRSEFEFHFLVHSNPNVSPRFSASLLSAENVTIHEKGLSYVELASLLDQVDLICTDSGGLQEEAAYLGKPIVVLREMTERPEALGDGAELVGTDPVRVKAEVGRMLGALHGGTLVRPSSDAFGTGFAARKIVDYLETLFQK